jgi:hypothetical protein
MSNEIDSEIPNMLSKKQVKQLCALSKFLESQVTRCIYSHSYQRLIKIFMIEITSSEHSSSKSDSASQCEDG